jgi:putative transposase
MDRLAGLSEETRKLELDRFHLLQPHLEANHPLRLVAAAGMPFRTAQRWVALYHQFGLTALVRRQRADRGEHRSVSAQIRNAIEGLAVQKPPLPIAALYRQVRRPAKDLGEEAPSYWVVYRMVRALPVDLWTLAHQGTKAYTA